MDVALLVVRALLAAVFAVAGAAKLADREGSRKAAADFGVPSSLAGAVGIGLPFAELAVAALLLPAETATWAALGAVGLLAAFSIAIGASIARGQAPDCHCFGQLHSEPAGWRTLLRNLGLAGAAAFVVGAGWRDAGSSAVAWIDNNRGLQIVAAVALAVAAGFAATLLARRVGGPTESEERADLGLPVGTPAPAFALPDVHGDRWTLERLLAAGRPALLVFTDTGCGPCDVLLPDLARWQNHARVDLTIAVVSAGKESDFQTKAATQGLGLMLSDPERATYRAYENAGTPGGVLVGVDGRIARPLAVNALGIHNLVEELTGVVMPPLEIGEEMPDLELPSLAGGRVQTSSLRGRETVVVFWEPGSEKCRALHPELVAWEQERAPDPRLVIVSLGGRERVAEEGFHSTVLLDEERALSILLRGIDTPSAVLFDAAGHVAWPLVHDAEHILRLLRSRPATTPAGAPAEMV